MGSPEGTFDTKLHEAVRNGIKEEVCEALKQGYDPNLIGLFQWNPVHEAADNGDAEILKLLIQKKGLLYIFTIMYPLTTQSKFLTTLKKKALEKHFW